MPAPDMATMPHVFTANPHASEFCLACGRVAAWPQHQTGKVENVDPGETCSDCGGEIIGYHICPGLPGDPE